MAKLTCILHLASFMLLSFDMLIDPFHTTAAKVDILNFKSFLLELQKHSQTADARGEAELRTLNSKTTWSECQRVSQTAAAQGEAELRIQDMVRVPEAKSNFCCTWQRWAAYVLF